MKYFFILMIPIFILGCTDSNSGSGSNDLDIVNEAPSLETDCKYTIKYEDDNGDGIYEIVTNYTYDNKGKLLLMEYDLGVNGIVDKYTEYSYSGSELASEIEYSMYGSGEYEIVFGKIITQTVLQDRVVKRVVSTNGIEAFVDHNSGIILEHYFSPEGDYPYQSFESMTEFVNNSSGQNLKQFNYSENFDNLHSVQYYENNDYMVEIDLGGDGTIDEQIPYPDDDGYYLPELNEYESWIDNNTKKVILETTYEDDSITKSSYYYVYDDSLNVEFEKEDYGNDGILDSVIEYGEYQCF